MDGKKKISQLTREELIALAKRQNEQLQQLRAAGGGGEIPTAGVPQSDSCAQHEALISELQQKLADATADGADAVREAEATSLREYVAQCEAQLKEALGTVSALEQQCEALQRESVIKEPTPSNPTLAVAEAPAEAIEELRRARESIERLEGEVTAAQAQAAAAEAEQRASDERWLEAMTEAEQRAEEVERLRQELAAPKSINAGESETLPEDFARAQSRIRQLEADKVALALTVTQLQASATGPNAEVKELSAQVSQLTAALSAATDHSESLRLACAEESTRNEVLTNHLRIQRNQNRDLQQQLDAALSGHGELQRLHRDLDAATAQCAALEARLIGAEVRLQERDAELAEEKEHQQRAEESAAAKRKAVEEEMVAQVSALEGQLADTHGQLRIRDDELATLRAQYDALQEELVETTAQLTEAGAAVTRLQAELARREGAHAAAIAELELQVAASDGRSRAAEAAAETLRETIAKLERRLTVGEGDREDLEERMQRLATERERFLERVETLERERINERKAAEERARRLDQEERSIREQMYTMKQTVAEKDTTIQLLESELLAGDRVRQKHTTELLEKESALKDLQHQVVTLKKELAGRDKKLTTVLTEKEGFAEIAGERGSALHDLQRSNASLVEQLTAARTKIATMEEAARGANAAACARAEAFCRPLLHLAMSEALQRATITCEESHQVLSARELLFLALLRHSGGPPPADDELSAFYKDLPSGPQAATMWRTLQQTAVKQAGAVRVLEAKVAQLEGSNKEALTNVAKLEAKCQALATEREEALGRLKNTEARAASGRRLLAEKMAELESLKGRPASGSTADSPATFSLPWTEPEPKLPAEPPKSALRRPTTAEKSALSLAQTMQQLSSRSAPSEEDQVDELLRSFGDLPRLYQESPPDHMQFRLQLTALLSTAKQRLADLQVAQHPVDPLLPPIRAALLPCLEESAALKEATALITTPYLFVNRIHALLSEGTVAIRPVPVPTPTPAVPTPEAPSAPGFGKPSDASLELERPPPPTTQGPSVLPPQQPPSPLAPPPPQLNPNTPPTPQATTPQTPQQPPFQPPIQHPGPPGAPPQTAPLPPVTQPQGPTQPPPQIGYAPPSSSGPPTQPRWSAQPSQPAGPLYGPGQAPSTQYSYPNPSPQSQPHPPATYPYNTGPAPPQQSAPPPRGPTPALAYAPPVQYAPQPTYPWLQSGSQPQPFQGHGPATYQPQPQPQPQPQSYPSQPPPAQGQYAPPPPVPGQYPAPPHPQYQPPPQPQPTATPQYPHQLSPQPQPHQLSQPQPPQHYSQQPPRQQQSQPYPSQQFAPQMPPYGPPQSQPSPPVTQPPPGPPGTQYPYPYQNPPPGYPLPHGASGPPGYPSNVPR